MFIAIWVIVSFFIWIIDRKKPTGKPNRYQKSKPFIVLILFGILGYVQYLQTPKVQTGRLLPYPVSKTKIDTFIKPNVDSNINPILILLAESGDTTPVVQRNNTIASVNFQFRLENKAFVKTVTYNFFYIIIRNKHMLSRSPTLRFITSKTFNQSYFIKIRLSNITAKKSDSTILIIHYSYGKLKGSKRIKDKDIFLLSDDQVTGCPSDIQDSLMKYKYF